MGQDQSLNLSLLLQARGAEPLRDDHFDAERILCASDGSGNPQAVYSRGHASVDVFGYGDTDLVVAILSYANEHIASFLVQRWVFMQCLLDCDYLLGKGTSPDIPALSDGPRNWAGLVGKP